MKCVLLTLFQILHYINSQSLPPSCNSPIYCYGDILHTVQMARVFSDGKKFVDQKMIHTEQETLDIFKSLQDATNNNPSQEQIQQFVYDNFEDGNELENYTLTDYNTDLYFLDKIANQTVRNFAKDLLRVWPDLARKIKPEILTDSDKYSLIPVPNAFIIPGGRFLEYYYWDSYWIIDGLLISEMNETAQGMIDNFLSLVENIGFIPNGGRVYYLQRSQPPLLTAMAHLYFQHTKNREWLVKNIKTLAKELNYWNKQSLLVEKDNRNYTLYQYNAASAGPRPESYREDYQTASYFGDEARRQEVYIDLKSGAESGWDFSSRWIFDQFGGNLANLSHIHTRRVIPVDLNAFLCGAYRDIAELYSDLGDAEESSKWHGQYVELRNAIDAVLWNNEDGIWYDYDLQLSRHRSSFYASNVAPLWAKCFNVDKSEELGRRVLEYLQNSGAFDYMGGIPTSVLHTGQQWDFPNAWAPLQDIVVRGLQNTKFAPAHYEAHALAERWVNSNIIGFQDTKVMFEKYDARVPGQYGGGGEYLVQTGFGWSNGVALRFIYDHYREIA